MQLAMDPVARALHVSRGVSAADVGALAAGARTGLGTTTGFGFAAGTATTGADAAAAVTTAGAAAETAATGADAF